MRSKSLLSMKKHEEELKRTHTEFYLNMQFIIGAEKPSIYTDERWKQMNAQWVAERVRAFEWLFSRKPALRIVPQITYQTEAGGVSLANLVFNTRDELLDFMDAQFYNEGGEQGKVKVLVVDTIKAYYMENKRYVNSCGYGFSPVEARSYGQRSKVQHDMLLVRNICDVMACHELGHVFGLVHTFDTRIVSGLPMKASGREAESVAQYEKALGKSRHVENGMVKYNIMDYYPDPDYPNDCWQQNYSSTSSTCIAPFDINEYQEEIVADWKYRYMNPDGTTNYDALAVWDPSFWKEKQS